MKDQKHQYKMGIVGNCSFLAYIDDTANVKWMCWPRFDSQYIFGSLLHEAEGEYSIRPAVSDYQSRQFYLENTNILCTEFEGHDFKFRVYDFAPRFLNYERYHKPLMLFRRIEILFGQPKIKVVCRPARYNCDEKITKSFGSNHIQFFGFKDQVRLPTNIPLTYIMDETEFVAQRTFDLVLSWGVPLEAPLESTAESFFEKTRNYWHTWVERCGIPKIYQRAVIRSALTLKLHQYEDTGAIIAAGTTSLPEHDQSGRNWDYRYCWIRDSHYTVDALSIMGHFEEMERFSSFIEQIAAFNPDNIQPLYGIDGRTNIEEKELELDGYLNNQPVRVGNGAYTQMQNDVFGQIMLSIFHLYFDRRLLNRKRRFPKELILRLLKSIEDKMDHPDAGLWEFRNSTLQHCYTFLFHWAGACAALKLGEMYQEDEIITLAQKLKIEADKRIQKFFNMELGHHTRSPDSDEMDASLLQLINMGYLDPKSKEAKMLVEKVEKTLKIKDAFLYRYSHDDDFGKPQVAFIICGFWYVEALARIGRVDEAIKCYESLLGCANDLGLLSEDVDPKTLSQWGNFPQTYSHVGVIHCAFIIDRILGKHPYL